MDKCAAINVLELISSLNYAGSQRALVNFCRYSDRHFFKMHVATYIEGGPREKEIHDLGIECVIFKNDIASLLKYVAQKNIQIVHFHRSGHYVPFEHLVLQKLKSQNPLLVIVETNIFGKYDARSASLIDCSLVISKMNLNEVFVKQAGVFDFNRMRTLYFPVDAASFAKNIPTQEEITAYKKKNNIQPADFVIGRLGRPDIAKWSDLLIETVPYLVKLIPRIKYLIQSAPESRKRQVLTGRYRDNFIFVEPSAEDKDIALFFSSLDVYAHASKIGESFGMTLAEAGLFKKPVVVNSTPQRDNSQVEVVNHMHQLVAVAVDFSQAVFQLGRDFPEFARQQDGGISLDGGERGAQFMGDTGDKIGLSFADQFQLLQRAAELPGPFLDFFLQLLLGKPGLFKQPGVIQGLADLVGHNGD